MYYGDKNIPSPWDDMKKKCSKIFNEIVFAFQYIFIYQYKYNILFHIILFILIAIYGNIFFLNIPIISAIYCYISSKDFNSNNVIPYDIKVKRVNGKFLPLNF